MHLRPAFGTVINKGKRVHFPFAAFVGKGILETCSPIIGKGVDVQQGYLFPVEYASLYRVGGSVGTVEGIKCIEFNNIAARPGSKVGGLKCQVYRSRVDDGEVVGKKVFGTVERNKILEVDAIVIL